MQGYRLTSFPVSARLSEVSSCEFKPELKIHWWRCTSRYVSGVSLNPAKMTSECSLLSVWLHRLKQNSYTTPTRCDFNPEETVMFCLNQMLKPTSEITTGRRPFSTGAAAPTSSRNPSLSQVCPTIIIRITFLCFHYQNHAAWATEAHLCQWSPSQTRGSGAASGPHHPNMRPIHWHEEIECSLVFEMTFCYNLIFYI